MILRIFGLIYLIYNRFTDASHRDLSDFEDFWIDLPDFQRFTDASLRDLSDFEDFED